MIIKKGQGKRVNIDELPESKWKQSEQQLSRYNYGQFYLLIKTYPKCHEIIKEEDRNNFIKHYEQAQQKKFFLEGSSNLLIISLSGFQYFKKIISFKHLALRVILFSAGIHFLNLALLEQIYNKKHLQLQQVICQSYWDSILKQQEYMDFLRIKYNPNQDDLINIVNNLQENKPINNLQVTTQDKIEQ